MSGWWISGEYFFMATSSDPLFGESDVLSRELLEGKTRADLLAIAKDYKISVPSGTKKADVLALISNKLAKRGLLEDFEKTDSNELQTMSGEEVDVVEGTGDEEEDKQSELQIGALLPEQLDSVSGGGRDLGAGLGVADAVRLKEVELEIKKLEHDDFKGRKRKTHLPDKPRTSDPN